MNTLNKQAGMTLNELMIALSVMALMLSLSAPSFSQFLTKRKVAGAANAIASYFENVKMQSISRNEFATITYKRESDGTAWCLGAVIGRDVSCDCMAETPECLIDSAPTVLSHETFGEFNEVVTEFEQGFISFDPVRGILSDPAKSVSMAIKDTGEDYRVNISVNATGRVTKCSPADHELVGYATCI